MRDLTAFLESHHVGRDYLIPAHRHPVYEVILLIAGRSQVTVGGTTRMAGPGDLLVFPPGLIHQEHVQRGPLQQVVLRFAPDALDVPMPATVPVVSLGRVAALRRLAEDLVQEAAQPDAFSPAMRHALLTAFVITLGRALAQPRQPEWIDAAVGHLGAATTQLRIADLARDQGVAPSTLRARIKAATGLPPRRLALLGRLERAADLLRDTTMSVTAVAYALDFSSPQHLARLCRAHLGATPSAIRARRPAKTPRPEAARR
jgi:AraC-like DNA-binding protein